MSKAVNPSCQDNFRRIIENLQLQTILPLSLHFDRTGQLMVQQEMDIAISWSQAFQPTDPERHANGSLAFNPRYTVELSCGNNPFFSAILIIYIVFMVKDRDVFEAAWEDTDARSVFLEKQILKTLWPILRQQVLDGLSRLGLPPFPLPWIVD